MVRAVLPVHVSGVESADVRVGEGGVPALRLQICAEVLLPQLVEALVAYQHLLDTMPPGESQTASQADGMPHTVPLLPPDHPPFNKQGLTLPSAAVSVQISAEQPVDVVPTAAGEAAPMSGSFEGAPMNVAFEVPPMNGAFEVGAPPGIDAPAFVMGPPYMGDMAVPGVATPAQSTSATLLPGLSDLLHPASGLATMLGPGGHGQPQQLVQNGDLGSCAEDILGRLETDSVFRNVLAAELVSRLGGSAASVALTPPGSAGTPATQNGVQQSAHPFTGLQDPSASLPSHQFHQDPSGLQPSQQFHTGVGAAMKTPPPPPPLATPSDATRQTEQRRRSPRTPPDQQEAEGGASLTTYVITKLPPRFDRKSVLDLLNRHGLQGTFDFFYAPCDFQTHKGKGYAFVNFKQAVHGVRFRDVFNNRQLQPGDQRMTVRPAEVQGFRENVIRILRTRARKNIRQANHLPLVFWDDDVNGIPLSDEYLPQTFRDWLNLEQPGNADDEAAKTGGDGVAGATGRASVSTNSSGNGNTNGAISSVASGCTGGATRTGSAGGNGSTVSYGEEPVDPALVGDGPPPGFQDNGTTTAASMWLGASKVAEFGGLPTMARPSTPSSIVERPTVGGVGFHGGPWPTLVGGHAPGLGADEAGGHAGFSAQMPLR